MWFLSCDGDHLGGKQLWLRPGSTHLFGRRHDKPNGGQFHPITHKSVSRQHFTLQVDLVEAGDSALVYKKSKLTITDLGSKVGTFVDSNRLDKDGSKVLTSNTHVIRLGNYDNLFHIKWRPIVLTFSNLTRKAKQATDPLAAQRSKVEQLDVKCVTEFLVKDTTHVIHKKRNTPSCLQALVLGRAIVTDEFPDALVAAAKRSSSDSPTPSISKLEQDFNLHWPSEVDYLPPPGTEPNPRGTHDPIFLPSAARADVFSKYTFVFIDAAQYDAFLPVVTGGTGKAMLHALPPPEDHPSFDGFLDFVKGCAGKKGDAAFRMSQYPADKGGIVVVRPADPTKIGGVDLFHRLDLALDQRSVGQNEFLDAILNNDASSLRRALEVEMQDDTTLLYNPDQQPGQPVIRESPPASVTEQQPNDSSAATPPKRKGRRQFTTQKLTTFDDFDPSQIVKYSPPPSVAPSQQVDYISNDEDGPSQTIGNQATVSTGSRKRPAASQLQPVESTEQVLDNLFTGTAMLKKRRLDEASRGRSVFDREATSAQGAVQAPRKTEQEQDEDVQRIMKERRQEEELRRQQDEESLRTALDGMNVSDMRNLAKIEEMDITPRDSPARNDSGADVTSRWKPEWNGRANWKKFKKHRPGQQQEDNDGPARRKVIVSLEPYDPHSSKDNDFWLQPALPEGENQQEPPESTRTISQVSEAVDDSHDSSAVRRRIARSLADDGRDEQTSALLPEEIGGRPRDPSLRARLAEDTAGPSTGGMSQLGRSIFDRPKTSTTKAAAPAARAALSRAAASKRAREAQDDDDDDDGLQFRRRRRV